MDQIREYLGADSIGYLDIDGMVRATEKTIDRFCLACFNGDYAVPPETTTGKFSLEHC